MLSRIDQVQYSERGNIKLNQPYITITNLNYPAVLIDKDENTFHGPIENPKKFDCSIIHPITKYNYEKPNWLTLSGKRKIYTIPNSKIKEFPALIMAYRIDEFEKDGIPADVVEILDKSNKGNLILDKGNYKIVIKNKEYKIVNEFLHNVKN